MSGSLCWCRLGRVTPELVYLSLLPKLAEAATDCGGRDRNMAPRLILSNAQKSAGNHAPISASGFCRSRRKLGISARKAGRQRDPTFGGLVHRVIVGQHEISRK